VRPPISSIRRSAGLFINPDTRAFQLILPVMAREQPHTQTSRTPCSKHIPYTASHDDRGWNVHNKVVGGGLEQVWVPALCGMDILSSERTALASSPKRIEITCPFRHADIACARVTDGSEQPRRPRPQSLYLVIWIDAPFHQGSCEAPAAGNLTAGSGNPPVSCAR
jgi:hypothetical protein